MNDVKGFGSMVETTYDVCMFVPEKYAGKKITGFSFWLIDTQDLSDIKAWVQSDVDYMDGPVDEADGYVTNVTEPKGNDKNTVTLSEPYVIPANGCYVGYSFTVTGLDHGGKFPVLSGGNDQPGGLLVRETGYNPYTYHFYDYDGMDFGCSSISVTIEGDFEQNAASIAPTFATPAATVGGSTSTFALVSNLGSDPITSLGYTVTDEYGNVSSQQTTTLGTPIAADRQGYALFSISGGSEAGLADRTISLTSVNGKDLDLDNAEGLSSTGYVDTRNEKIFDRTILLEKFTGQECGVCPSGENNVRASIAGLEERVARIDHHAGYYPDDFTLNESLSLVSVFDVRSAPNCMVDRTVQPERQDWPYEQDGVVWNPLQMTSDIAINAILRPSPVNVVLDAYLEQGTRNVIVVVGGQSEGLPQDACINACLTQSGYEAFQYQADNWLHDDFPIKYFTSYQGDALAVNADGSYEHSYSFTLPEKIKVDVDLNQLDVVAFVARRLENATECEVFNSAKMHIAERAVDNINTTQSSKCTGTVVARYTADGRRVTAPVKGINIVKTSDGRTLKVMER